MINQASMIGAVVCAVVAMACRADGAEEKKAAESRLIVLSREFGESGLLECDARGEGKRLFLRGSFNSPAWSPDGARIAYFAGDPAQIFVMKSDGSNARQLTNFPDWSVNPVWLRDGTRIVFQAKATRNWELYSIDAEGGEPAKLTMADATDVDPAISPDGRQIAFGSWHPGGPCGLHLMNVDGTNRRALPKCDAYWPCPAWSPDSRSLVFGRMASDGTTQLFVADVHGPSPRQITRSREWNDFAAWSPDGRYIAYVHYDKWPKDESAPADGDLMVFDVVEESHKAIVRGTLPRFGQSRPAWKPLPKERAE